MVRSQRMMLDDMKVDHLRLILGTSMGCMQAFVWGETYPGFSGALAPFACLPVPIAGRNRMMRYMAIQASGKTRPWNGRRIQNRARARSAYRQRPGAGDGFQPAANAETGTHPRLAEQYADRYLARSATTTDANDLIFYFNASRNYDPSPRLESNRAPLLWINSADDFINRRSWELRKRC